MASLTCARFSSPKCVQFLRSLDLIVYRITIISELFKQLTAEYSAAEVGVRGEVTLKMVASGGSSVFIAAIDRSVVALRSRTNDIDAQVICLRISMNIFYEFTTFYIQQIRIYLCHY